MSTLFRSAVSLGLGLTLAALAGCSSTSGGTTSQRSPDLSSTTAATTPTQQSLATLTLDASSALLYAEPSTSSLVVAKLASGDQLSLIDRTTDWLQVRTTSGTAGFIQTSALVDPSCTTDRAEPRVLEIPVFAFQEGGVHNVVVEAEFDANGQIINTRVLENSSGNPALEQEAIADLHRVRLLPPTKDCKPRPFFYTFTRQF